MGNFRQLEIKKLFFNINPVPEPGDLGSWGGRVLITEVAQIERGTRFAYVDDNGLIASDWWKTTDGVLLWPEAALIMRKDV